MTQEWTKNVTPQVYLKRWPNGPQAKLALSITKGLTLSPEDGRVRFFSPRSKGLQVVVDAIIWSKIETPAGTQTLQTAGLRADFENGYYQTDNLKMIEYLTNIYADKRYPVVRTDVPTKSAKTL